MIRTRTKSALNIILLALISFFYACGGSSSSVETSVLMDGPHQAEIKEVIHTNAYSYLLVEENSSKSWIAATRQEFEVGQTIYFISGMAMENFQSKELDHIFELVYFVDQISFEPLDLMDPSSAVPHGMLQASEKKEIKLEKAEGGITIGELYADAQKYEGQEVKIRGEVVKFNEAIMGRNWVHIQDGSGTESAFDLALTTQDMVAVGDVVVFSGTVSLNKDFGAGYIYEVILEESKLLKDL